MQSHPLSHLVALGKQQGFLTYEDMHSSVPESIVSSERGGELMSQLEREHIEVLPTQSSPSSPPLEDGRTALMMTEENEDPEARTAIVELLKNRGAAT